MCAQALVIVRINAASVADHTHAALAYPRFP